jgi:hypothetical protein
MRMTRNIRRLTGMLLITLASATTASAQCKDPLPIDPDVVTKQMKLKGFGGATQAGPVCMLQWDGGAKSILIYGPTALAGMGRKFTSAQAAAAEYKGESPKGVEPVPGAAGAYMVFDPKTPNRRVFVEYQKRVYMIVSQDQVSLEALAQSIRR